MIPRINASRKLSSINEGLSHNKERIAACNVKLYMRKMYRRIHFGNYQVLASCRNLFTTDTVIEQM